MRCCWVLSETPRGAGGAPPRRDKTMTQNSDSGDAVGRRGTYNRQARNMGVQGKDRVSGTAKSLGKKCLIPHAIQGLIGVDRRRDWTRGKAIGNDPPNSSLVIPGRPEGAGPESRAICCHGCFWIPGSLAEFTIGPASGRTRWFAPRNDENFHWEILNALG
jgi:hypothetical protein